MGGVPNELSDRREGLETWLVPVEGWLVDKYGPRIVVLVCGVLCGLAWWMNSWASTLTEFYIAGTIAGIGAGGVYGTCVGNALRWFPDQRGAVGLAAMGFGAGSARGEYAGAVFLQPSRG